MNTICKKTLVIGIILLFVGVSVSSAISIDSKPSVSNVESEECSDCRELSKAEMVKVKHLINRLEVYSKLIFILSRHNPELREISEELSNFIHSINWYFPIICGALEGILYKLIEIYDLFDEWIDSLEEYSLMFVIALAMLFFFYLRGWFK